MAETTRPPVVTILGHVDHGKTTLLDYIRKTSVTAKEHGGITQSISAYQVEANGKLITFIDTPGHAAFEKMRSRGAQIADIAVLVVACDDGVMPQTVEAIKHIKSADIPMIVAVNKIDLPGIDIKVQLEKIKKQLSDNNILVEEYGGDVPLVQVSAKSGQGVDDLLETINLVAEIHEFKGDPNSFLKAVVIESHLDKYKGAVATILVRDGSLKKGDPFLTDGTKGKVRGMFNWSGQAVGQAGPSTPVEVLGFEIVPAVGSTLGETAEEVSSVIRHQTVLGLADQPADKVSGLVDKLKATGANVLNVVIKADKQGSLEAVESELNKFNTEGQHLKIISTGTGEVTESDVQLCAATKAIVLGFNVSVRTTVAKLAQTQHVVIRTYNIIYELLDEIEDVVEGMLKPGEVEEVFGRAQIVAEFPFGKGERIAGCKVIEGHISKAPRVKVVRDSQVIGEARIKSMKRLKEEVSKIEKGQDCGILFDPPVDFTIGDIVESYRTL